MIYKPGEYYWIKTNKFGWEICYCEKADNDVVFIIMGSEGVAYPSKSIIKSVHIPYPEEDCSDV